MKFRETIIEDFWQCQKYGISGGKFDGFNFPPVKMYTLIENGNVVLVCGIMMITETCAWGFVELTKYAVENIYSAYRAIQEKLEEVCRERGILRLQAFVECGVRERELFAEHLGFNREGSVMRDFLGKNVPAYLYVKYFED